MSNYAFIVHTRRVRDRVERWLAAHAAPEDVITVPLDWRRQLTIVSHQVRESMRGTSYFRGTATCPDEDAMIFSVDGWLAAPSGVRERPGSHSGVYLSAEWRAGLALEHDVFGAARLIYTSDRDFAAASDSLLVLADLRRALGAPLTANPEVLIARTALNEIAGQQISDETLFREISYVPGGRGLRLRRGRWELTGTPMAERVLHADLDYRDTIRASATDVARAVATLAEVRDWMPVLSLSGGFDSRLVFAAIIATGSADVYRAQVRDLGPQSIRDVPVATALAERFGVRRAATGKPIPHARDDEMSLWASSLMGVYDGYGPIRTRPLRNRAFSLSGIGAEIHKGNWGWVTLHDLAAKAAPEGIVREALEAQLRKSAATLKIDPLAPNASEIYYLGYRNGIHGSSGHVGVQMTGVHPIMQLRLAELGHLRNGRGFQGSPAGIADNTILLSPEVAAFEYDDPARNLDAAYIDERIEALGGRLDPPRPYRIYGHPDDGPDGASSLGLGIARAHGFSGPLTSDLVSSRFKDALDVVQDADVRAAYEEIHANAVWRLDKLGGNLRAAGISPPRMTMLELLRLAN